MIADEERMKAYADSRTLNESKEQRARRAWLNEENDNADLIKANRKRQKELEKDIARLKRLLEGKNG